MKIIYSNPCTRCGKQRIDRKSWKEKIESHFGVSYIVHTETACPDKKCQIIVEAKLEEIRKRSEDIRLEKERRIQRTPPKVLTKRKN